MGNVIAPPPALAPPPPGVCPAPVPAAACPLPPDPEPEIACPSALSLVQRFIPPPAPAPGSAPPPTTAPAPRNMDDYVPPERIIIPASNLIDNGIDLQNEFDLALNELVATFPTGKLTPDISSNFTPTQTYGQEYNKALTRMLQLQEKYFMYKNSILQNSKNVLKEISVLDEQINTLDNENKVLTDKLSSLKSSSYSAKGMLDDSKISRNQLLLGNICLFLIVSSVGYIYYKKRNGNE
jgi:hypothetical protein